MSPTSYQAAPPRRRQPSRAPYVVKQSDEQPSPDELIEMNLRPKDAEGKEFYYGRGCGRCNNTGHRGRFGIFELVTMDDEVRELIATGSTDQLRAQFWAHGMTTLREAGMKALFNGVTTIHEVDRLTVLIG